MRTARKRNLSHQGESTVLSFHLQLLRGTYGLNPRDLSPDVDPLAWNSEAKRLWINLNPRTDYFTVLYFAPADPGRSPWVNHHQYDAIVGLWVAIVTQTHRELRADFPSKKLVIAKTDRMQES